jgi:hypothetical protein
MKTFEQFLEDKCPCHTNNSPEGFERWLEQLDVQEVMDYAEDYGKYVKEYVLQNLPELNN